MAVPQTARPICSPDIEYQETSTAFADVWQDKPCSIFNVDVWTTVNERVLHSTLFINMCLNEVTLMNRKDTIYSNGMCKPGIYWVVLFVEQGLE